MGGQGQLEQGSAAGSPSIAFDVNLGFPSNDPNWQSFFATEHCAISSTADLDRLTDELKQHSLAAAYLPAANAYFLRNDTFYTGLANALTGPSDSYSMTSLLVVKRDGPFTSLAELKGKRLGRINPYCTTSFFAPAILLHRSGYSIHDFFGSISNVGAWQKQIDAVMAGVVDASMVDADTWKALPANAENTRVLGMVDHLPTPVVLGGDNAAFNHALRTALLAERRNPQALFSGFVPFREAEVENFFKDVEAAFAPAA